MKKHLKQFTVTNQVSTVLICEANLNEENRIKFVTDLAAISRGKHESANPSKRYKMLLEEAAPVDLLQADGLNEFGSASRPLEFLGIVLGFNFDCEPGLINITTSQGKTLNNSGFILELYVSEFVNLLGKFSFMQNGKIYTNMRACINAGIPYEQIPYNTAEELAEFKAVRIKAPMFVFNHLVTHTALSKEARSERVTSLSDVDYWLPSDFRIRLYKYYQEYQATPQNITSTPSEELQTMMNTVRIIGILLSFTNLDDVVRSLVSGAFVYSKTKPLVVPDLSQEAIQILFKELGYPKEIYQRTMLEFRYKEFILTGWYNNPQTWKHLFLERNAETDTWKNWTQPETATVVSMIKNVIEGGNAPS